MSEKAMATDAAGVSLWVELAIGIVLVAVVLLVQQRGYFNTNTDDAAADKLMRFHAGVVQGNTRANPFALIAIDEQTYRDWGEPLITPRDKLAKIIKFAIEGPAKLIFLDIELSRLGDGTPLSTKPRTCGELRPSQNPGDQLCDGMLGQMEKCAQFRQLRDADADLCDVIKKTNSVPIILARTIVARPDARPSKEQWKIQPSFIPDDGVHWASPLYSLDSDRFIRRSRLWELVCENKQWKAVPSVELLGLALINDNADNHNADALNREMASISGGDCGRPLDPVDLAKLGPLRLRTSDGRPFPIDLAQESPGDRILYTIGWSGELSRLYADQPGSERSPQVIIPKNDLPNSDRKADLLTTISARAITDVADSARPDSKVVKDHIVVIGATHREAGDLHETPLGLMPGSLIIINAIHSLREHGQLAEPSKWQKAALATVVMIIAVLVYRCLWSTLAALVVPVVIFFLAFCLNVLSMRQGVWIDAALPALIYAVFKIFLHAALEFRARAVQRKGAGEPWFRACLRALRH